MAEDGLPPQTPSGATPMAVLKSLRMRVEQLTEVDWHDHHGTAIEDFLHEIEQIHRRLAHVQTALITVAEANNHWAESGFRSINTWVQAVTGGSRMGASRSVRLARALRHDLPETSQALAEGRLGREHAQILQREVLRTTRLRDQLASPEMGELFLVGIAQKLTADDFRKAVKHWATMADPEAADRNWREESDQEEVFLSAVGDSYYLSGRLNKVSGRALETALTAQMGRKSEGDERTPAQRRAAALVSWAHSWLDSGDLTPGARIRPHLSVHVPYETLAALCEATASAVPPAQTFTPAASAFQTLRAPGGPKVGFATEAADPKVPHKGFDAQAWADAWQPEDDHVISTAVDHSRIRGAPPATLDDGTALPPNVLSRLACGSKLTRIVFGAESTIIDVGREQRIFPANQTRAIVARDRHCQYPSCTEPPEFGEIHHSLWWWKHNGKTSTDQGILLCWYHHAYVHENNIVIARIGGKWVFSTEQGNLIVGPGDRPRPAFRGEHDPAFAVEGSSAEGSGSHEPSAR